MKPDKEQKNTPEQKASTGLDFNIVELKAMMGAAVALERKELEEKPTCDLVEAMTRLPLPKVESSLQPVPEALKKWLELHESKHTR